MRRPAARTIATITTIALATIALIAPPVAAIPRSEAMSGDGRPVAAAVGTRRVAAGLAFPAAFTFAPDGRIVYGERFTGEIRILNLDSDTDRLLFDIPGTPGSVEGEQGLLGIALHPDYPSKPLVYAFVTRLVQGDYFNQIVRLRNEGGNGTGMKVIFSSETGSGDYHDGGRILFGPDGMLYAIVGDSHSQANSQDLTNPLGKILRMRPDGTKAPGNPFGNRIFAYGIRNSFGFAFDPANGRLWESEAGPGCNDELNRIPEGRNMGWGPNETCEGSAPANTNQDGPNPVLPKRFYTPTITPTGMAFCSQCGLGQGNDGKLFLGAYNTGEIRRVSLTQSRLGVQAQQVALTHEDPILSMERGPEGGLYVSDPTGIHKLVQR